MLTGKVDAASLAVAPAPPGRCSAPAVLPTRGRRRRRRSGWHSTRTSASHPLMRRGAAARRRLHRRPLRAARPNPSLFRELVARARSISQHLRGHARLPPRCRRAGHGVGRRACGLLRAVRARADPQHQRPEGQECRHPGPETLIGHHYLSIMAANVGLDPQQGHQLGHQPRRQPDGAVRRGKVDAFLGFPPEPQELRARNIGRVIISTVRTSPGRSISAACSSAADDFVHEHPVATKRFLRAILKAADFCATEPKRVAQRLVGRRLRALRLCAPDADRDSLRRLAASTTPRTRCASTRCGCTRPA